MVITIKDTDYEVHFGIAFVRKMDEKYFVKSQSGVKFGTGLETAIPMLLTNDVITLSEFLYTGTCTEKKRPTQADVDAYVDGVEDIEALFEEVIEELKKHNATKMRMIEVEKSLAEELAKTKKK